MWPHGDKVAGRRRLAMGITVLVVTGCGAAGTEPETAELPTPTGVRCGGPGGELPGGGGRVGHSRCGTGRHDDDRSGLRTDERFSRFSEIAERTEATIGGLSTTWFGIWDTNAHLIGDDRDGVTVFAPTDAAFEALDPAILAVIDDPNVDNALLRTLLGAHYVHRLYPTAAFEPGPHPVFRGTAAPVEPSVDPLAWGGHALEHPDIRTANGYIHAISGVVIPEDVTAAAGSD